MNSKCQNNYCNLISKNSRKILAKWRWINVPFIRCGFERAVIWGKKLSYWQNWKGYLNFIALLFLLIAKSVNCCRKQFLILNRGCCLIENPFYIKRTELTKSVLGCLDALRFKSLAKGGSVKSKARKRHTLLCPNINYPLVLHEDVTKVCSSNESKYY
jgi:hypothetical protein